ncbi:probable ATP-dependent DNA helicase HFM1 [Agrilus planipennis]|uniref:Probable ATP-dependent DNA helicase HFM1 n=1 Tax=Agrilus planipennis TaxID=224129 RepID=A0A7F5R8V5_AGRPL|nr:probable ATP-dependent DNA helicase HFM1 [Agrilus planipennis]
MDLVSTNQRLMTSYESEKDWSSFIRENNLRSVEEIPENYRHVFSNFTHFNKIQSKVFDDIYYTDHPVVISSPTGSGKTVLFELAIIRFLINLELINRPNAYRMVYISPLKALCDERLIDWHDKFNSLGVNCISVTGDNENYDLYNLKNFALIITTPEKWDSLTRKWRNNKILMQSIKLFMIDEVHLLNEDSRGSTLEVVVSLFNNYLFV